MLTTEFLGRNQFSEYGSWLKSQDPQTLHDYFGYSLTSEAINSITQQFSVNSKHHRFLIAKVDGQWAGTIHIAEKGNEIEFGVIVAQQYRKQGIANAMMDEAITWARNRFYKDLFMHCITWNRPIKHLCRKHGLVPRNMSGDSEANLRLTAPTYLTFFKEQMFVQRNWIAIFLPYRYKL